MKPLILASALALLLCSQIKAEEQYYIQQVTLEDTLPVDEKINIAAHVVPSPQQKAWQDLELTAFAHFGVNTFTGKEWGDGKEDKAIFAPSALDCEQWVKALKDGGFKLVLLTAKHHDGFCLWPTATTSHCVTPDKDVVKALRKACDKHNMKLGLYLSPWDQNAVTYGTDEYNDFYIAQLTELLTNYGKIDEIWFDGACGEGPNGKKQVYNWPAIRETITRLQPNAVTAIMGTDVRWVGNENGMGRETEWSVTPLNPRNPQSGLNENSPSLGGDEIIANAKKLFWYPSEVDVSIRDGWFYHDNEQPKSLKRLAEIYLSSVGRNSGLLLNVPPNQEGKIAAVDSIRLKEFGTWVKENFENAGVKFPATINCVDLGEDITKGQRVGKFNVKVKNPEGEWVEVAQGTTIGRRRILTFPEIEATDIRIDVENSRGIPNISSIIARKIEMPL